MATCPAGHQTSQSDFCDICGLPVPAQASATVPAPAEPAAAVQPIICPHCRTPNVADALFCEACGYDFTTGGLPEGAPAGALTRAPLTEAVMGAPTPAEPSTSEPDVEPMPDVEPAAQPMPDADPAVEATAGPEPEDPASAEAQPGASESAAVPATAEPAVEAQVLPAPPVLPQRPVVEWVAELWIDPDWYTAQGSSDPMPSPSLPDIVPLVKDSSLIGRVSHSRGIFPDVDCDLDTGCSRRHALLTTDGSRWWIEDLDSANGTFVGAVAGPLPAMPIPQGRVEVNPGQRIYVGAWTRIVIRRATQDEKEVFA